MTNKQFKAHILEIENEASEFKYTHDISSEFQKLLDNKKLNLTEKQIEKLKWEFLLFRFMAKTKSSNRGMKTRRFRPMATFEDGSVFPDIKYFSEKSFKYFKSRANNSTSTIMKARYFDFLWEESKLKDKHLFAIKAIREYLANLEIYKDNDRIWKRFDCFQRSAELALCLQGKKEDNNYVKPVIKLLVSDIETKTKNNEHRWLLEPFELVIDLSSFFEKKLLEKYINLCQKAATHFHNQHNFHLQRSFLGIKLKFVKIVDSKKNKVNQLNDDIGQSYISEAKFKSGSNLVKAHFLQEAIQHYLNTGFKEKAKTLITEVKKATKKAIDGNEFHKFETKIEIKEEDIAKIKKNLGVGVDALENIGSLGQFFPNWNHAIQLTQKLKKKYVFQNIFPTTHYGSEYLVGQPITEEEMEEDRIMRNFSIEANLNINLLTRCILELIKESDLSRDDFKTHFEKLKKLDENTYDSVLDAIDDFFNERYYQSTTVLVLQLEDFLRKVVFSLGNETTVYRNQAFKEQTLKPLLESLNKHVPEPIYRFISWVMEDYRGINLRNNVAHGFYKKQQASPTHSVILLQIFCIILSIVIITKKKDENIKNR